MGAIVSGQCVKNTQEIILTESSTGVKTKKQILRKEYITHESITKFENSKKINDRLLGNNRNGNLLADADNAGNSEYSVQVLEDNRIKMLEDQIEKLERLVNSRISDIEILAHSDTKYCIKSDIKNLWLCGFCYKYSYNDNPLNDEFYITVNTLIKENKGIFHSSRNKKDNTSPGYELVLAGRNTTKDTTLVEEQDSILVNWNWKNLEYLSNLEFIGVDCLSCNFEFEYVPKNIKILYIVDYQKPTIYEDDINALVEKCPHLKLIILHQKIYNYQRYCNLEDCYDAVKNNKNIRFNFIDFDNLKDGRLEMLSNVRFV